MRCDLCDEPADIHMTNVDAETGRKTEKHFCARHFSSAGLSADAVQLMSRQMERVRKAMGALQVFVETERRVPSVDELRAMAGPVLPDRPDDSLFPITVEQLQAMARMMLAELSLPPLPE